MASSSKILKQLKRLSVVTGDDNGCDITFGGSGAYFQRAKNGNRGRINFPAGDFTCPDYLMLVNGLSDHENGHARFTEEIPQHCWNSLEKQAHEFVNSYRNLFEDIRMEGHVINTFPGSRSNLAGTVEMAIKFDIFGEPQNNAEQCMKAYFLYGLRSDVLTQTALFDWAILGKKYMLENFSKISGELESIFSKAYTTQSNRECFELAKELYFLLKEESENENSESQDDDSESDDSDSEDDNSDDSESNDSDSDSSDDDGENENSPETGGDSDGTDDRTPGSEQDSKNTDSDLDSQNNGEPTEGDPNSATPCKDALENGEGLPQDLHEALMAKMSEMAEEHQDSGKATTSNVFTVTNKSLLSGGKVDTGMAIRLSRPVKQTLQRILFQKNRVERSLEERGRKIAPQRIAGISCGTKDVFTTEKQNKAPNAAISILVDNSGSMGYENLNGRDICTSGPIKAANTSALALCKALEQVKGTDCEVGYYPHERSVYIAKTFGQKALAERFTTSFGDCTPTGEAMHPMLMRLATRPEPKKLMFVITDGCPDNVCSVKAAVELAQALGIKVYGLGIGAATGGGFEDVPFKMVDDISKLNIVVRDLIKL